MDERKNAARAALRGLRDGMDAHVRAAADAAIAVRVAASAAWESAETVFAYLSFGSEVDTRALIERGWRASKTVALPRCVPHTRTMTWHRVRALDELVPGSFGILEPVDNPATRIDPPTFARAGDGAGDRCGDAHAAGAADPRALALVPGLAFDAHGFRIGYGGGFYDVFLAAFGGISVGLCRDALLHPGLADAGLVDAHDLPVRFVATETRLIDARAAQ